MPDIKTSLINIVLSGTILLCIWQSSLWVYDRLLDSRTYQYQLNLQKGQDDFRWDFDDSQEVRGAYKLDEFKWQSGVMQGDIEAAAGRVSNADFWLNLNGRYIDTIFLKRLSVNLYSETENEIYFFHQQVSSDALHASQRIKIQPGWQIITLDMSKMRWTREDGFEKVYVFEPSSWGGQNQIATLFGVSPTKAGVFKIDWLKIQSDFPAERTLSNPIYSSSVTDQVLNPVVQQRNRIWQVVYDSTFRRAETDFLYRQAIKKQNPNVMVYSSGFADAKSISGQQFLFIIPFVLALVFCISLTYTVYARAKPDRTFPQLVVLVSAMLFLGWTYTTLVRWQFITLIIIFLVLLYWYRPEPYNFSIKASWQSWLTIFVVTFLPIIILVNFNNGDVTKQYRPGVELLVYMVWALLQQAIFLLFIYPRCKIMLPRYAIVISAGIFGFVHFPNFSLMCATFIMGLIWNSHYEKYQNLYAIAFSHAVMALFFRELAPAAYRLSGEVGLMFLYKVGALT